MKLLLFFLLVFIGLSAKCQPYDAEKVNKKAISIYEKAMVFLEDDKLKEAIPMLKRAIDIDNRYEDAYLSLANLYGEMKEYKMALEYFEKAKLIDTSYFLFFNLPYSINLAALGRFGDALNAVNAFLALQTINERSRKSGEYRKRTYEFGLQYLSKHPVTNYVFNPINMGDSVNSPQIKITLPFGIISCKNQPLSILRNVDSAFLWFYVYVTTYFSGFRIFPIRQNSTFYKIFAIAIPSCKYKYTVINSYGGVIFALRRIDTVTHVYRVKYIIGNRMF